jgi:hypothetical protein
MSEVDRRFHETWLGMVQPIDGLVLSIPVLEDAQCMERQPPHVQALLVELCPPTRQGEAGPEGYAVARLDRLFAELLGYAPEAFDAGETLPEALSLYVPEGRQILRPTIALKKTDPSGKAEPADATPASTAGAAYEMLVWQVPAGLDLDKAETVTGPWEYPPSAKMDRLLRHCRVPLGLLTNGAVVRLVYAPHGESSGAITFRLEDMVSVGGRPILDAFVMLLAANRFFGVTEERTLPALLAESRKRQANVTTELADQVFQALQILLRGFEAAAERDGRDLLDDALAREGDHLYKGLLAVLLRLVFVLYAEDRGLLPVDHPLYAEHLSVLSLFEQLQADQGAYPDSMARRFGAWGRLVTLFRAVFLGVSHGDLKMPPRHGSLFFPHTYPFLEGWGPAGSAPITQADDRAAVKLPTVDDATVFQVLEKLLVLDGQRLSYRALDVEQIGSVYEALMGYHVLRMPSEAVCMRPDKLWVSAEEVLEVPAGRRAKWLKDTIGLSTAQAEKLAGDLADANGSAAVLESLARHSVGGKKADPSLAKARPGQLVLQPGTERRRTSSHYTPRSLSAPIVRRTLEPLLAVMGDAPASERILNLKVCDPAMGSGAFLVEACRFLADHVLAAWTRENKIEALAAEHGDPLLHARRLVAQRCLYGVDKNAAAVELAKLSLWLVTLSKTLPFTFLDHSLRHGDSLVGLDFDQIRAFHWKRPEKAQSPQLELFGREIAVALDEAIHLRQQIGDLGDSPAEDREKASLFWNAQDALDRVRLIADVVVGAFFAHEKDKDREAERARREALVRAWLPTETPPTDELLEMQRESRARVPSFHWMVEFPEVFYAERPDPLDDGKANRAAYMDAFVGNPPFLGGSQAARLLGKSAIDWITSTYPGADGRADYCAHFFTRTAGLLGKHGCLGLIATNTIAQGDTRQSGLAVLVHGGFQIYHATTSTFWPGAAAVSVSIVHMGIGHPSIQMSRKPSAILDGRNVNSINSRLQSGVERPDPVALASNTGRAQLGVRPYGDGFIVGALERNQLVISEPGSSEVIHPYLGGEEVNTSPGQDFHRYIVNFGERSLEEAEEWPRALAIVRERVKPYRDGLQDTPLAPRLRQFWWQFYSQRTELAAAIAPLARFLVTARVTKHLCFSFQPKGRVLSEKLYVFPLDSLTSFAVLQSQVHGHWTWTISSTMKNDLNYSASDCFDTFPFPVADLRTVVPSLEDIGSRLYDFRAAYMADENVGLTVTYNRLKDPTCSETRILELRKLHEEMDQKVLEAYAEGDPEGRWLEVEVPPYCPLNEADKKKVEAFEDAVIDRLFVLNAKRAADENRKGLGGKPAGKGKAKAVPVKADVAPAEPAVKKPRRGKKAAPGQGSLGMGDPEAK